jgi:hypothetical protein
MRRGGALGEAERRLNRERQSVSRAAWAVQARLRTGSPRGSPVRDAGISGASCRRPIPPAAARMVMASSIPRAAVAVSGIVQGPWKPDAAAGGARHGPRGVRQCRGARRLCVVQVASSPPEALRSWAQRVAASAGRPSALITGLGGWEKLGDGPRGEGRIRGDRRKNPAVAVLRPGAGADRGAGSGWRSDGAAGPHLRLQGTLGAVAAMLAGPHPGGKLTLVLGA